MKTIQFLLALGGSLMVMAAAADARTWTAADGKRTIEGDFVSATQDSVTIRKGSGNPITLKFEQVSEADREFVRAKLAETAADEDAGDDADAAGEPTGKYDDKATGKWESGKHEALEYRFYAERKLRRSKTKKFPLVIYLHGRGGNVMEREEYPDGSSRTFSDEQNYKRRPCFILVPQAAGSQMWNGAQGESVIDLIKDIAKELPVDQERIYITGYSMGGYGTWWALGKEPKLFAAGVPVAGGGNPSTTSQMRKIPIWAFHGAVDKVVPVEQTRAMVEALEERGKVKYTEFPDKGHDVWTVYQDEKVHEWLFEQTKGK